MSSPEELCQGRVKQFGLGLRDISGGSKTGERLGRRPRPEGVWAIGPSAGGPKSKLVPEERTARSVASISGA